MKRGKDDDKIMGPMFPRLHVNDTDKGGPRAPPRNKMALYEQLSIPSQRFSHVVLPCNLNNGSPNLVPPSSQSGGNDEGMFFPRQVHPRYPSEKQYSQFSELSSPLAQVEQRKKSDEDDYRVPIFIHSVPTEFDKYSNCINREKISSLNPPSKFQKPNRTRVLEQSTRQEGENKNGENSNKAVAAWNQTVSSLGHETGDDLDNSTDGLRADDSGQPEVCAESQVSSDTAKRDSSSSEKALPSEDENIVYDLSDDTGSREDGPSEDGSCRPLQTENLERADSVSEASILDAALGPDITPDDVVGIIGQKQFWKARRAIANQQRVFAIQVFELHRLIKVQKLFAASPHLLLEDTAYFGKPIKPLSEKKRSLDDAVKTNSNAPKRKSDTENASHRKEFSAENTVEKASLSSGQNGVLPSSCRPSAVIPPAPATTGVDHNTRTPCFSHQQQAHQWLVPVMSPTEGLIYKAYSGTGFVGQACGGCGPPTSNPMIGNFLAPAYGIPAPPHQYPFPSFPPFGPHGYYPPYGMPIMNTAAFSGSSIEQMNPTPTPGHSSAKEAMSTVPTQENEAVPDGLNSRPDEEIEVQASTSSSPNEREPGNWASRAAEGKNMLPLFPTSPAITASKVSSQLVAPDGPIRVIKVVPRNGISASESAARIFQSIQEERKQYDSA